jgi:hypothetical protein
MGAFELPGVNWNTRYHPRDYASVWSILRDRLLPSDGGSVAQDTLRLRGMTHPYFHRHIAGTV